MKIALSYWKRYDLVFKHFSSKKLFKKILGFAKKLGEPFTKKSNRGPKFKINPYEYAAYTVFEIIAHNAITEIWNLIQSYMLTSTGIIFHISVMALWAIISKTE